MQTLKEQGIKALVWDFLGKISTHGMSFIISIVLTRLLEPSDFGLIAIIMVVVGVASIFTDLGLGSALIQRKYILPIYYSSVFYLNVFFGFMLTILIYFLASWISKFYDNESLLPLLQTMSLLFIINAFSSVQSTKLRKELNYALLTKISLGASAISGVVGIILAYLEFGVWSLVAQSITAGLIYNILIWIFGRWRPSAGFSFKALERLWSFGFRMFLVGFLDVVYTRADYLIVGKLFPIATLGFYQRAKSLNMILIEYSSGSLMSVLFPVLSAVQNDLFRFQKIVLKSYGIINFVVFLLFGSLFLVSEELIVILFSNKWLPSVEYFQILVLSGFAYPINALLVNVLSSRGNSRAFLKMAIYKKSIAFLNLGVVFLFGIKGFLYGLVIVAIINTSITIFMASEEGKISKYKLYKPIFVQGIIAVMAVFITSVFIHNFVSSDIIMLVVKLVLFSSTYIFANYLFKTLSFQYFLEEIIPLLKNVRNKMVRR